MKDRIRVIFWAIYWLFHPAIKADQIRVMQLEAERLDKLLKEEQS
jgi:hypothetical protein